MIDVVWRNNLPVFGNDAGHSNFMAVPFTDVQVKVKTL
jgi:hypothetical protein